MPTEGINFSKKLRDEQLWNTWITSYEFSECYLQHKYSGEDLFQFISEAKARSMFKESLNHDYLNICENGILRRGLGRPEARMRIRTTSNGKKEYMYIDIIRLISGIKYMRSLGVERGSLVFTPDYNLMKRLCDICKTNCINTAISALTDFINLRKLSPKGKQYAVSYLRRYIHSGDKFSNVLDRILKRALAGGFC